VGTMNILAAKQNGKKATVSQQRNLFVEVEHSDVAEKILARSKVLHIRRGDRVYIVGEDALNFANIFNKTTRRPMSKGILSRDEKSAIPMLNLIVERLLGKPAHKGEVAYFSCPARPSDASHDVLYHQKTVEAILRRQGYEPRPVNEGMAVAYAELADTQFTGMGLSFGAGMTNACLAYYGVPVMTCSSARGGDWIDEQVAEATGLTKDKVTAAKERGFSLAKPGDDEVHRALAIYYDSLLDHTVRTLSEAIRKARVEEGQTIPVAVTGGTASPPGFRDLLWRKLEAADLPFQVGEVRHAKSPLFSVAVGALVAARAEEQESLDDIAVPKQG